MAHKCLCDFSHFHQCKMFHSFIRCISYSIYASIWFSSWRRKCHDHKSVIKIPTIRKMNLYRKMRCQTLLNCVQINSLHSIIKLMLVFQQIPSQHRAVLFSLAVLLIFKCKSLIILTVTSRNRRQKRISNPHAFARWAATNVVFPSEEWTTSTIDMQNPNKHTKKKTLFKATHKSVAIYSKML